MTRYELVERIGFGGMAEVFRGVAIAAGGFEKPVAIKRILPHLSEDKRFVELLIAEAKFLSQLRHRNIVQIYDVGLGDDGQYFLVMEYVDGLNLGKLYDGLEERGKRLPADIALHIGAEVCDALEHAHRARGPDDQPLGLVHRDVSPSNVLLSRSGEVKLTDFGIAKRTEDHTGHGGVRGKFAYISPEQASSQQVDARSDVFSLGVVLYELVLGHRLYSHLADFEALRSVLEGRLKRPRTVDASLAPELEDILLTALAHDPDQRFASAGELGSRLRNYRYTVLSTSGDPSAELASILDRYGEGEGGSEVKEHTVVRLRSASGFTGQHAGPRGDFREARAIIDAFEEETRAVEVDASEMFAQSEARESEAASESLDDEQTTIMAQAAPEPPRSRGTSLDETRQAPRGGATKGQGESRPRQGGGAAEAPRASSISHRDDHTVRELYYADESQARSPEGDEEVRRPGPQSAQTSLSAVLWLVLAALAVAVSAFLIASAFFAAGGEPGAGEVVEDAGAPSAARERSDEP